MFPRIHSHDCFSIIESHYAYGVQLYVVICYLIFSLVRDANTLDHLWELYNRA